MENQAYHIQALLADELDICKDKGNSQADNHIKKIQDAYKINHLDIKQLMITDKGKQIQDEEVFLYKLYDISSKSSQPKIPKPALIQDKINNLEKHMQSPVKTILFYLPSHYKYLKPKEEQDKQYWNEVAIEFLKQKHNANTTRRGFTIKMYIGEPPHEPYFVTLTL